MQRGSRKAFTLIELMVVVAILGTLSAIAIPSFSMYIRRSKTAEVAGNLDSMFKSAASYYTSERSAAGQTASVAGHCTVDDAGPRPAVPKPSKQRFVADASFQTLGFTVSDLVYFSYGLASAGGVSSCDHTRLETTMYTFYANGDLDGDGTLSTFELAAGSNEANILYHSRGIHSVDDTE